MLTNQRLQEIISEAPDGDKCFGDYQAAPWCEDCTAEDACIQLTLDADERKREEEEAQCLESIMKSMMKR